MFEKIVGAAKSVYAKGKQLLGKGEVAVGVGLLTATEIARAALPPSVATTVAEIEANAQSMFDAVFPVVATIVGLMIVIKLFKRFANKA